MKNMSINMFLGEVDGQTNSITSLCNVYIEKMEALKNEVNQFTSQDALQGKAYTSSKNYFSSVYIPLANGIIMVSEEIISANSAFTDGFRSEVDTNDVVEDILVSQINRLIERIAALEAIEDMTPGIRAMIESMRILLHKLKDKLQRLYVFNPKSLSYFDKAVSLLEQVETGLAAVAAGKGWNSSTNRFSVDSINMAWSRNINSKWETKIEKQENEAIAYMDHLATKVPQVSEDEVSKLFKVTKGVEHVDIPEKLKNYLMEEGRELTENFTSGLKSSSISTVLEASGNQVKNISQLIMYYSGTWGPDGPNSFVMVSPEAAKRTTQAVRAGSFISNAGKIGVPVVGGIIDFKTQVDHGESAGDAAVKAGAHVAIGLAGGKAGAAAGAFVGSVFPGPGTVVGAAAGFVAGVVITVVGNYVFDKIYDNRVEIYNGAKDMAQFAGKKISKVGSDIGKGVKKVGSNIGKGAKKVGNAVSGLVGGLGSVFG